MEVERSLIRWNNKVRNPSDPSNLMDFLREEERIEYGNGAGRAENKSEKETGVIGGL